MTSKPKPTATSKKRPQAEKKPAKAVIAKVALAKVVVAKKAAPVPEKDRKAVVPAPKKSTPVPTRPHSPTAATLDAKAAAKLLAEKPAWRMHFQVSFQPPTRGCRGRSLRPSAARCCLAPAESR
jgi:hypothetical protein